MWSWGQNSNGQLGQNGGPSCSSPIQVGTTDYALITDFTVDDVMQLKGASGNYSLAISGSDTHLYLDKPGAEPDELIAVLQNSPTTWHQNPTNNHSTHQEKRLSNTLA